LLSHLKNTLAELSIPFAVLGVLDNKSEDGDPFRRAAVKFWVNGGKIDLSGIVGPAPAAKIRLPTYPWQRKEFRIDSTVEALPVVPLLLPVPTVVVLPEAVAVLPVEPAPWIAMNATVVPLGSAAMKLPKRNWAPPAAVDALLPVPLTAVPKEPVQAPCPSALE